MEIILDILGAACVGILQSIVGILWPSVDPSIRRLQRVCAATVIVGFIVAATGVLVMTYSHGWHFLTLYATALVLFVVAGAMGRKIEEACRKE
jgi:predicted metal-binding membrane protein